MVIFRHELKQNWLSLLIWSTAVSMMLGMCVLIFPDMGTDMGDISAMFSDMGSFSAAFGMDKINFGEFIGFFGVECGNVLGLGGAFFAALTGVSVLAKEEKNHTAEFLLTFPLSRARVLTEKLLAVIAQVVIFNAVAILVTAASIAAIGEEVPVDTLALIFFAYFIMQLEIAAVTFGISAALRRGGVGIGLGLAAMLYFLNIVANLADSVKFLKYITPFGYTDSADIISEGTLEPIGIVIGLCLGILGVVFAYLHYTRKDIT